MKATVYGETAKATEYKKELIVTACGMEWFEFSNGWKLNWDDTASAFTLHGIKGRLMARHCYVEIG